ncbi:MAG: FtsX-like permease family protein [Chloroflexota bacterium]|nr:MAG: FtsX-like permease family protein [Chloroflexota bacterium]
MILGIALGVAVAVAIDLANVSASRAFDLSTDAIVGRATHQIVAGSQGLDDTLYVRLRAEGVVRAAAPIVSEYVSSPRLGNRPLQLMGVDPFAEAPFRSYMSQDGNAPTSDLTSFLTRSGAILLSADVASRYRLSPGTAITLEVGGYQRPAFLAGLLQPADNRSQRALDGVILADIATAQELTGRIDKLDRIDLIVPERDSALIDRIQSQLPEGARVVPVAARTGAIKQMTDAFRLNLMALSLLALVVGMFLIYNTMTFSVVQRRPLFGTLRCLGATRREVFALVVSEALIVGVVGAGLGLVLGTIMGQGAARAVTQTINDLYFVLSVRGVEIPLTSLLKGALMGTMATAAAAALPAWEAASVPPRAALSRSGLESKAQRTVTGVALGGLLLLLVGVGLLMVPASNLIVSFAGTFAVVLGFAMLTPLGTVLFMRIAALLLGRLWGTLGRMAPRDVINSSSRTSVAVAALMVALSVTIGITLMVGSFRHTVEVWLGDVLRGDVFISVAGPATAQTAALDPAVVQIVQQWPGVDRVGSLRSQTADSPDGPVEIAAVENPSYGQERSYVSSELPPDRIWEAMQNGAVIVSEPYANRVGLPRQGGTVTLYTADGSHAFPVVAIYYDYSSSRGIVSMSQQVYRQLWHDDTITTLSLRLAPGADPDVVVRGLQDALAPVQHVLISPNRAVRDEALAVFDRTFAITSALQILVTVVAFIGILSALLALQLDKQRDLGNLRAVGLTVGQLSRLVLLQTGLMGVVAGLLSMPTGLALSLILIHIINRRSFGWTLLTQIEAGPFLQALAVGVIAALLAGIYPIRKMARTITAEALRFE